MFRFDFWLVVIIATVSAALASGGIVYVLGDWSPALDPLAAMLPGDFSGFEVLVALCFVAMLLLQRIIVWAWYETFRQRGWIKGSLLLAIFVAFLSAASSSGTVNYMGDRAGLQEARALGVSGPVLATSRTVSARIRDVQGEAQRLMRLSNLKATRERKKGGTCANDPKPEGGEGKFQRFRDRHAARLDGVATRARDLYRIVDDAAVRLVDAPPSQATLDAFADTFRTALRSDAMEENAMALVELDADMATGWIDGESGLSVTCEDTDYHAALRALLDKWSALSTVSLGSVRVGEAGWSDSFAAVLTGARSLLDGGRASRAATTSFVLAVLVELLQMYLVRLYVRHQGAAGMLPHPWDAAWSGSGDLDPDHHALRQRVADTVDPRLKTVEGELYLVTANPITPPEREARDYFGIEPSERCFEEVPRNVMQADADWFDARRDLFGEARAFDLSPLPRAEFRTWMTSVSRYRARTQAAG